MSDGDYPMAMCPHCRAEHEDLDGFGVVHCRACGYCTHISIDGDVCNLCGATVEEGKDDPAIGKSEDADD